MTNILPQYYDFLEQESSRSKKSKRDIIEEALSLYIRELKKQSVMNQYKKLAGDVDYQSELNESAELGIEYYLSETEDDH